MILPSSDHYMYPVETPPEYEHCPYCGSILTAQHQCMSGTNHYLDEYWEQA
jgi:predicted  nucleic acid-binding Zn-ribbon protein